MSPLASDAGPKIFGNIRQPFRGTYADHQEVRGGLQRKESSWGQDERPGFP